MDEGERQAFRDFLRQVNYDADNEFLCVNELQAYFSTERQLFGWASAAASMMMKGPGRKAGGGSGGWSGLLPTQRRFVQFARGVCPRPTPAFPGLKCLFDG